MKNILINEPGGFGDVIICLPIAKWFHDRGHFVAWRCQEKCFTMLTQVPYIGAVVKTDERVQMDAYEMVDLELGSEKTKEASEKWRAEAKLTFDEWKYEKAGVPIDEKFKLQIKRFRHREVNLLNEMIPDTFKYYVVHQQGSVHKHTFRLPDDGCTIVEIGQRGHYTIFDWISVIESAEAGYFVNSCIVNLVNGLGLLKGRRFFRPWYGHEGASPEIMRPKLVDGWEIIPQ